MFYGLIFWRAAVMLELSELYNVHVICHMLWPSWNVRRGPSCYLQALWERGVVLTCLNLASLPVLRTVTQQSLDSWWKWQCNAAANTEGNRISHPSGHWKAHKEGKRRRSRPTAVSLRMGVSIKRGRVITHSARRVPKFCYTERLSFTETDLPDKFEQPHVQDCMCWTHLVGSWNACLWYASSLGLF